MGPKHSNSQKSSKDPDGSIQVQSKDFSSLKRLRSRDSDITTTLDSTESQIHDKILTLIEYELNGTNINKINEPDAVFLTGSFTGWDNKIKMNCFQKGKFSLIIPLNPGIYEFKFIVNNEWVISDKYPTINDERGIINNIIDNNNKQYQYTKTEISHKKSITNCSPNIIKRKEYVQFFDNDSLKKLNVKPPEVPDIFINNISYRKNTLIDKSFFGSQNSYKEIKAPLHFLLSHLNIQDINESNLNGSKYIKLLCTCRIRQKMSTIIYYNPINT